MPKILLITTGGTIASRCGEHGLRPVLMGEELRTAMGAEWDEIEIRDYLSLDSCNIIPAYWEEFAREIDELRTDYDGFIVTHGTDTMAYTSAALYYMLENLDRPVVLTGSQRPLGVSGSDAEDNLRLAHRVALFERTLADCERVLGPDHPHTRLFRKNLAAAYRAVGRDEDAAALLDPPSDPDDMDAEAPS